MEQDRSQHSEVYTTFSNYDGRQWHMEVVYVSSLTSVSQNSSEVVIVRREILSSPLHFSCDVVIRFLGFVLTFLAVFEAQYWLARSFIFSELFRSGSGFRSEVSFNGDACDYT